MAAARPPEGHARRLATGSLAQQASQVSGLLAMLAVVTVLARQLSLAEFGVYGLLASLAGYLLVVQNAAAGAAVRELAAADEAGARDRVYSNALVLYSGSGLVAGIAVALVGIVLAEGLSLSGDLAEQARAGAALLGGVTALSWPLTIARDALRARQLFVRLALVEITAVLGWAGLVVALGLGGASLTLLVAASGAMPAFVGVLAALATPRGPDRPRFRRGAVDRQGGRLLLQLAGWLSLAEAANPAVYAADRAVLGVFDGAGSVGLLEGPVRAANVVRALNAAVVTTVLPAAARLVAERDERRLRELVVRGLRYSLALMVPVAVTGIALAPPVLEVWLGARYREGGTAMAILLALWLPYGASGVLIAVLVAAGRARTVARYAWSVAGASVLLALALIPPLGLEGAALAAALPFTVVVPFLLRAALEAGGASAGEVVREAFVPAYALGLVLAAALFAARAAFDVEGAGPVVLSAAAGVVAYWLLYYGLVLRPEERALFRSLIVSQRSEASKPGGT
jgi:O-antigen/teichoic acid export membrane protein